MLSVVFVDVFVCFFKQKTAYEMRISDWSSDVCSSDLRDALAASRLIQVDALATAFEISNRYAPEHLILALRDPRAWLDRVQAAGSVFLGDWTPEALGDY